MKRDGTVKVKDGTAAAEDGGRKEEEDGEPAEGTGQGTEEGRKEGGRMTSATKDNKDNHRFDNCEFPLLGNFNMNL